MSTKVFEEGGDRETLERITEVIRAQAELALRVAPSIGRVFQEEFATPCSSAPRKPLDSFMS